MIYDDSAVLRITRSLTAVGLTDGQAYTFQPGTLCTVVLPGDGHCEVEFVIDIADGIDCALATVEDGDAELVPRSSWSALAAE